MLRKESRKNFGIATEEKEKLLAGIISVKDS